MSIKGVTADDIRRMTQYEGLVLPNCGGNLQEWFDGINELLTEEGILLEGSRFDECFSFQHEGRNNLLFPMKPEMKINVGKFAIWRLRSHEQFEGMWLSDYVSLRLGGPLANEQKQASEQRFKPDCQLIGQDSNIFNLMGLASRTLKENGMGAEAAEMRQRINEAPNYNAALSIIGEYVNITEPDELSQDLEEGMVMR